MANEDYQFPAKPFHEPRGQLKNFVDGFKCVKATEPLRKDNLLFTSKSPGVNGTRLINLRRMKGQCILSYSYKPFRHLSLFRNFSQFCFKTIYVTIVGVNLEIYFRLPENSFCTINFYSCPQAKLSPMSMSSPFSPPHTQT